jgi:hypothetical protein
MQPGFNGYGMEDKRPSLPSQRNYEYAYTQAYELACAELAKVKDIRGQCRNSGAQYQEAGSQKLITLQYLNHSYRVTLPEVQISLSDSREAVSLKTRVLLLHYLIRAKGTPLSGQVITFKELPEGVVYAPTFAKRTLNPLTRNFGKVPHRLVDTAAVLGGQKAAFGDVSVTISVFPRVPITLVLWQGDSEFPTSASIMFDATVSDYLPTEDIIVACEAIVWTLVRSLKTG